jgi:hypothetical protein
MLFFYAQKIATERRCFVSQYITGYNFVRLMAVKFKWYLPVLDRGKKTNWSNKENQLWALDIQHHLAL